MLGCIMIDGQLSREVYVFQFIVPATRMLAFLGREA